ncbi:MAG: GDP-mannose 4,6-dehydratase [Pseudobdellovibrionaceae bacterium]
MKRVLIAGGAGFIGSHLADLHLSKGDHVTVVDNLITGQFKNIEALLPKGLQFINADITEPLSLRGPFDQIYNLASPASPVDFKTMPLFILRTASVGHENLLKMAVANKARILMGSTSEVYGDALEHPQRETYFGNVNPNGERSCYDEGKRYTEALSMAYIHEKRANACIARIFNTYGPRMRLNDGRVIPNFMTQAAKGESLSIYGQGIQTRSLCYVSDLVAGLYALMQSDEIGPINIGNPHEMTILELANEVNKVTQNRTPHRYLPLPPDDPKQRRPDITKAKTLLDWQPMVSLEVGLKLTYEAFREELKEKGSVSARAFEQSVP